jgi:hypothetical protein
MPASIMAKVNIFYSGGDKSSKYTIKSKFPSFPLKKGDIILIFELVPPIILTSQKKVTLY